MGLENSDSAREPNVKAYDLPTTPLNWVTKNIKSHHVHVL